MLRYLLDTNIVIYVLKRRPIEVLSIFNANAGRMAISSITLAEHDRLCITLLTICRGSVSLRCIISPYHSLTGTRVAWFRGQTR